MHLFQMCIPHRSAPNFWPSCVFGSTISQWQWWDRACLLSLWCRQHFSSGIIQGMASAALSPLSRAWGGQGSMWGRSTCSGHGASRAFTGVCCVINPPFLRGKATTRLEFYGPPAFLFFRGWELCRAQQNQACSSG